MNSPKEGCTELTIVPLGEHIAAEVRGIDAASLQGEQTFAELRRALYRYKETPPVRHVLVRTVPETGEKALYVGSYASHIIGWDIREGRALLEDLLEWATQPRFVYRHCWKTNDLVMWDNRSCLHRGRPWENGIYKRIMHRTTLAGDGPTVP